MKITPSKLVWVLLTVILGISAVYLVSRRYPTQTFLAVMMVLIGWFLVDGLFEGSIAFGKGRGIRVSKATSPIGYWSAVVFYAALIGVLGWMMFVASTRGLNTRNEKARITLGWSATRA